MAYARRIKADEIYILSATYGLLDLAQEIAPYEKTLNRMPFSVTEVNEITVSGL